MELDDKDIQAIKSLIKKEIEQVEREGEAIVIDPGIAFLSAEEKYEDYLKSLLKKLE